MLAPLTTARHRPTAGRQFDSVSGALEARKKKKKYAPQSRILLWALPFWCFVQSGGKYRYDGKIRLPELYLYTELGTRTRFTFLEDAETFPAISDKA